MAHECKDRGELAGWQHRYSDTQAWSPAHPSLLGVLADAGAQFRPLYAGEPMDVAGMLAEIARQDYKGGTDARKLD